MGQALVQFNYNFRFFTTPEWPDSEVMDLISNAIEYLHAPIDGERDGPITLVELIHVMMPLFMEQTVIRAIRFPTELSNRGSYEGMSYLMDHVREVYCEADSKDVKSFAEWYLDNFDLTSMSPTYREWFADDLRYVLSTKQVFFMDNEVSLRMYEKAKRWDRIRQQTKNVPVVSVW